MNRQLRSVLPRREARASPLAVWASVPTLRESVLEPLVGEESVSGETLQSTEQGPLHRNPG